MIRRWLLAGLCIIGAPFAFAALVALGALLYVLVFGSGLVPFSW